MAVHLFQRKLLDFLKRVCKSNRPQHVLMAVQHSIRTVNTLTNLCHHLEVRAEWLMEIRQEMLLIEFGGSHPPRTARTSQRSVQPKTKACQTAYMRHVNLFEASMEPEYTYCNQAIQTHCQLDRLQLDRLNKRIATLRDLTNIKHTDNTENPSHRTYEETLTPR